ncbi:MAG TPA: TetR/AcrR family transcriptional regulator [Ktedonobacterales bacterium]|jgi:TetR/AcrR family transcriptional regulator|nr:TetR/AcrR family transcriptional regulator [Ktedonobacterales bacterium]
MDEHHDETASSGQRDRQREILDAAFEEFATEGFRGATIKRIARRAQLQSQALIYWYFPTKDALFQAVLGRHLPILQLIVDPMTLLDQPPEVALPKIAHAYLAMTDHPSAQRLLRLIVPELIRRPEEVDHLGGAVIARALDFVKRYLARQVELGRLRPHDVRASARAFVGMLLPQLGGKLLFPTLQADGLTNDEHIEAVVGIFLRGLAPQPERQTRPSEPDDPQE